MSRSPSTDQIQGKRKIGPLPEATGLASAELIVVNRGAADPGHCDLAIETANGRGWLVVPGLMECTSPPVAHDGDITVDVERFEVTRENEEEVLTLAWTETSTDYDVDNTQTSSTKKFTTRCTIGASTLPRCAKPTEQP